MAPQEAFREAANDAQSGSSSSAFLSLSSFIQGAQPIIPRSQGGKAGKAPSEVEGNGDWAAWPLNNPFSGSNAEKLWADLSSLQTKALGRLPSMDLQTSSMTSMRTAWARDLANYGYLQALHPYMEVLLYDARQVLSLAQEAKAKIADAKQLAQQNTGNAASDALAAAQALADIQAALADLENADNYGTSVTDEMAGTYSQYVTATSSDPTVTVLKPLAPGGKSVTVTVDLPARTTEPALYSQSQVTQAEDGFDGAMAQLCESLSGSSSGNGDGGLLGDAASWQRAIVTQGVFNNAQNAYNDIQKVEKDLDNVKSASNPGAAIDSLNRLQSDLTPLINSTQDAVNGMTGGNQALHALGQSEPYSASDISDAQTPLTSAMPLASASNASNPIQKAVKDGSSYDAEHPIAAGMSALEPAARTLIGQGSEPGEAQKALSLPFKTAPAVSLSPKAAPSPAPEAAPRPCKSCICH